MDGGEIFIKTNSNKKKAFFYYYYYFLNRLIYLSYNIIIIIIQIQILKNWTLIQLKTHIEELKIKFFNFWFLGVANLNIFISL